MEFGASETDPKGCVRERVGQGDVIVIPAGCTHRAVASQVAFSMVGAYPSGGEQWDMKYGRDGKERLQMEERIRDIPIPTNPLTGASPLW